MPIYEYVCRECEKEFEELLKNRDEKVSCPSCGRGNVARRISIFGFKSGSTFVGSSSGGCGSCSGGSCGSCSCSH